MTIPIGVVSPGAMGSAIAAAAGSGIEVFWASEGRSQATRERAEAAGMTEVADLRELVDTTEILLSICPPSDALPVARRVLDVGYTGVYVDANAIASGTAREMAGIVGEQARFIDGGIIGPPPEQPGTTRLYLAGDGAERVAAAFEDGPLEVIVLDGPPGAASALKSCYAANTKAGGALLLAIRALATAEGVDEALAREWEISQPHTLRTAERWAASVPPKAWRFVGEMHEIGDAFDAVGLPDGFLRAAAELYDRLSDYKGSDPGVPPAELLETILDHGR